MDAGPVRADERYLLPRGRTRSWNRVRPLRGGREIYATMLAAISRAEREICLEMYIFKADRIGRRFVDAMVERARAGVSVRVLLDAFGCYGLPAEVPAELAAAGGEVVLFEPVRPWRRRLAVHRRDHRKLLVVDRRVAFTGGINVGDEYDAPEDGGGGWHDVCAELEGPAVGHLLRVFARTWEEQGGSRLPEVPRPRPEPPAEERRTLVEVIANRVRMRRPAMRRALLHAIRRAERRIDVMSAYFIPDVRVRRALVHAAERGVLVRVVVPSRSDLRFVRYASRHVYAGLLREGVRIFEWQDVMMHAKTVTIDGVWSTIGSYNLDRRSFVHNLEVGLLMVDRELARELERQFEVDLQRCCEIDLESWARRPRWERWLERFWFSFRYWL